MSLFSRPKCQTNPHDIRIMCPIPKNIYAPVQQFFPQLKSYFTQLHLLKFS